MKRIPRIHMLAALAGATLAVFAIQGHVQAGYCKNTANWMHTARCTTANGHTGTAFITTDQQGQKWITATCVQNCNASIYGYATAWDTYGTTWAGWAQTTSTGSSAVGSVAPYGYVSTIEVYD